MNGLAQAARILANLPKNHVTQFPSGRWGFCGSVRADLAYRRKDGSPLTDVDIDNIRQVGPRLAGVASVTFDSREDALAAI